VFSADVLLARPVETCKREVILLGDDFEKSLTETAYVLDRIGLFQKDVMGMLCTIVGLCSKF